MHIAARIRHIRIERDLSLDRLAAKTGLAKSMIARLEDGQVVPTFEMLEDLADAAGVPLYKFFFEEVESARTPNLMSRVTWKELTEECQPCGAPVPPSKAKNSVAREAR
jgi:transcriptional regulator with XRE-family HTH domain